MSSSPGEFLLFTIYRLVFQQYWHTSPDVKMYKRWRSLEKCQNPKFHVSSLMFIFQLFKQVGSQKNYFNKTGQNPTLLRMALYLLWGMKLLKSSMPPYGISHVTLSSTEHPIGNITKKYIKTSKYYHFMFGFWSLLYVQSGQSQSQLYTQSFIPHKSLGTFSILLSKKCN